MQSLIKGVDILLHNDGGTETVKNVLVGEYAPAQHPLLGGQIQSYTLGIPKGDTHVWTDRIVVFFGERFRTIGYPEQGIEANIPLNWHKKVKVEQMVTNGDCTFYEKDTFRKHICRDVFFYDHRGCKVVKSGILTDGDAGIMMYGVNRPEYSPKPGDLAVFGDCPLDFSGSSQQEVSETMAQLRREYKYASVSAVTLQYNGTIPDHVITLR